jgi:hypothetical protein
MEDLGHAISSTSVTIITMTVMVVMMGPVTMIYGKSVPAETSGHVRSCDGC